MAGTNETDLYIQRLLESNPLRERLLRYIIQSLQLPHGSRGLDAGCGIGLQTLLLLEAIGTDGHVVGLDILPELVAYGVGMVERAGLNGHITFREGSVDRLPFEQDSFDWAWSADCIGYPAGDLVPALEELIRVVRPGGSIFLLGWSSQQLLPGYPILEARLHGTCSGYLPFLRDKRPDQNFIRGLHAFQKEGLEDIKAQTFLDDLRTPLEDEKRMALASMFEMLWGTPQPEVSEKDWSEYRRLCSSDSPDFILKLPEYYGFFTYAVFSGRVPKIKKSIESPSS